MKMLKSDAMLRPAFGTLHHVNQSFPNYVQVRVVTILKFACHIELAEQNTVARLGLSLFNTRNLHKLFLPTLFLG